uniref:DNA-3-methyladenine glycosylase n=1 Tax=uncultured Nocardioidaceae bacterium TaxID=253824 RepID=A0A6J4LLS0_9ACTN|nr:MAG: DNA-3-methyladenine glycosylase [uncultured Nocardioidaceae bacterium]
MSELVVGDDGLVRCPWGDRPPDLRRYHDEEWAVPVRERNPLFERITLEAFQSGLSWLTVLRKRERFREVFAGFDVEAVAAFGEPEVVSLLDDPGIVRNRAKIEATLVNARAIQALDGDLAGLLWSFAPAPRPAPRAFADVPATTPESAAMAKELKRRGFRFVGPTTAYALMEATGMVDDHLAGCCARRT